MDVIDERTVCIEGLGYGGEGFARTASGRFISVPHSLPGDRLRVRVGEFFRGRAFAEVVHWLERAPDHVDPQCRHYDECSGCALRHVALERERRFKLDSALEILRRYGPPGEWRTDPDWIGLDGRLSHRTRGRFRVERQGDRVLLGLRALGPGSRGSSWPLADVRDCPAQSPAFAELMTAFGRLLDRHPAWAERIQWVEVRVSDSKDRSLVVVSTATEAGAEMINGLAGWAVAHGISLGLVSSDGAVRAIVGAASVVARLESAEVAVPVEVPWESWTHASAEAARRLVAWVEARARELEPRRLLDLCSGIGTLTFALAPHVTSVIAVDEDFRALGALQEAADRAGLTHIATRAGRVGTVLRKLRRELAPAERPDLVVINPMRRPLGPKQLADLQPLAPRALIYAGPAAVSAARDCATLARIGYRATRTAVADLHPGTAQMMLVAVLEGDRRS